MSTTGCLRRALVASAVLGGALATAAPAAAAPSAVTLRYSAPADVPGCLSERELLMAVGERAPPGTTVEVGTEQAVRVTIGIARAESAGQLRATIVVDDDVREGEAVQELIASDEECRTLGVAAALAAGLAIERTIERRREPPPQPSPGAARGPSAIASGARAVDEPPRPSSRVRVVSRAAALVSYGVLPSPAAGSAAGAAVELGDWAAGLEAAALLPAAISSPRGGGARAALAFVALIPCRRIARFEACAVAAVGDFRASGTGSLLSRSTRGLYATLGLRGSIELVRAEPFAVVLHAGVLAPLLRTTLRIGDELLWKAPAAGGEAGLTWRITIF